MNAFAPRTMLPVSGGIAPVEAFFGRIIPARHTRAKHLTTKTFDAAIDAARVAGKKVLVVFYHPWSQPCDVALDEVDALAAELASSRIEVALVNGDRHRSLFATHAVEAVPHIALFTHASSSQSSSNGGQRNGRRTGRGGGARGDRDKSKSKGKSKGKGESSGEVYPRNVLDVQRVALWARDPVAQRLQMEAGRAHAAAVAATATAAAAVENAKREKARVERERENRRRKDEL